jgi:hypothetical protein
MIYPLSVLFFRNDSLKFLMNGVCQRFSSPA